jgi:ATP-dependent Lon protease
MTAQSTRPAAGEPEEDSKLMLPDILSILPLRDTVLFPQAVLPLAVARVASVRLVDEAVRASRLIGVVAQRDPAIEEPGPDEIFGTGTAALIHKVLKQPDGTLRLVVQGIARFRVVELIQREPFLKARIEEVEEREASAGDLEVEALTRNAASLFQKIIALSPLLPDELAGVALNISDPGRLTDVIGASLPTFSSAARQELLAWIIHE